MGKARMKKFRDYGFSPGLLPAGRLNKISELEPFFPAVVETVDESVYDALFASQKVTELDNRTLEQTPDAKGVKMLWRNLGR